MARASGFRTRARLVLFVEDDPAVRELYGSALNAEGFSVEEAASIAAAAAALEFLRPDVIVLDRELPDGDAFDALRSLRVSCARACVPVVAFTASTESSAREKALAAGCTAFVRKPCAPALLVRHVWEVLGTPSSQRPRVAGA